MHDWLKVVHRSQRILGLLGCIEGTTVYDALEKGFDDLADLCDVVTEKFTEARDAFMAKERQ